MRQLTPSEILSLREMLQMESNAMAKGKATLPLITDNDLRRTAESSIEAMDARVKGLQQFIAENNILRTEGVQ
ncbi:hypothetical protein [Desulforamulus ruminis]|uniref:Uncharacterized protein n=1 Tax=Desulforamulus ruminis (strain ATCC 23193 / DSM 2154 / NCIMB 8452 / DL) TaxID=696281 RepID=F6DP26_DESRL|nr:hypothetical protein [Desulforamulus ruminis]AEG60745.1 hypothetical protein Desru_2514 [Desulforamulus ruminis DSM 2154]